MPIQFLGMVRTNNISEIHGAGPTTGEDVIDPPFLREFFRAHDQNNFDRVLIGQHSQAADGDWLPKDDRYRRTDEYLDVVKRTWASDAPFDFEGEFYTVRGAFSTVK